jgi:acetoin utilization deacetylase AcuC-like enzyme
MSRTAASMGGSVESCVPFAVTSTGLPLSTRMSRPFLFYTDEFVLPLPDGHRFPMEKYRLLRERLTATAEGASPIASLEDLAIPPAASDEQILRAHDPDYLSRVVEGRLTRTEVLRIGFPWSVPMVERCRRSSGATIVACEAALELGFGANLAGGTHHAFADAGEGFCVFNDSVIAARELQARGCVKRVLVVDCDVHQGNGTAAITRDDASIFTFSIHGASNFPFRKEVGDLDIGLADGTAGPRYMEELANGLEIAFQRSEPDFVIYVSGADPFRDDRFGRLALDHADLRLRDELVFGECRRRGLPVAVSMAGGYARDVNDTVAIHLATIGAGIRLAGLG